MRLITIKVPQGQGEPVVQLALQSGASQVSVHPAKMYFSGKPAVTREVVEVESSTAVVKNFVESLLAAPFYDPQTFSFAIRHPQSAVGPEPPRKETYPVVVPTVDVYEDLWQFNQVTFSLVGRVFLASSLLAYGMVEMHLPLMIAGLLFLPYHHQMLCVGLGGCLREWQFFRQGVFALLVSTAFIFLAGICVGLLTHPPIRFDQFGTPLTGVLLATVIGIAAGLGSVDDAGRKELIGLAATAHISVYPAWFGLSVVFGFPETKKALEHLLAFGLNVVTLSLAAGITYALAGMRGDGIRRLAQRLSAVGR